jgi:leader peptidase (prepilin peptidase)/N-methyltransferase
MLGAFLGWQAILEVIFLASLCGSIVGVPLMLLRRESTRFALPFGPFLAFSGIVVLLWGQQLISWYLDLFRL